VAEHLVPEPPDGATVLLGDPPVQVAVVRDDHSTSASRDQRPHDDISYGWDWSNIPEDAHWWLVHEEFAPPFTWAELTGDEDPARLDYLLVGLNRKAVTRLFTAADLDAAVRAARLTPVGEHLMEPSGYCRTCGIVHSNTEWARLHDQLAGDGRGDS
jgi:hypothetical protein